MRTQWRGWSGRLPRLPFSICFEAGPIACVDILPYWVVHRSIEVGLIQRRDAHGRTVWNLVGGGIHRGESVAEAAARHMVATLGPNVEWIDPDYSRPDAIGEYFPVRRAAAGHDARKHAIAQTYTVQLSGRASVHDEAITFRWFREDALPIDNIGFGQEIVVSRVLPIGPCKTDQPSRSWSA
jgi:hypothetical protein